MMKFLFFLGLSVVILLGCNKEEIEEKIDLEAIKDSRSGLDYHSEEKQVFSNLDNLLKEWQEAQRSRDHGNVQAIEKNLYNLTQGHFSVLVNAFNGDNQSHQVIAAAALGFSEDIRSLAHLIKMLKHSESNIRANAAMSIGQVGSSQTPLEPLFKLLKSDPNDKVRSMVVFAIYRIIKKDDDKGALPHLLIALKDKFPGVRNHALIALAKITKEEAVNAIIATTLNDKVTQIRYNSIRTLGKIKSKEAIPALIKKLKDPVQPVQQAALEVLKNITNEDFLYDVEKWEEWAGLK